MATIRIQGHLNCAICLDVYTDPRRLPCDHVFCFNCLQGLLDGSNRFACPECRTLVTLGVEGLSSLRRDLKLASIVSDYKSASKHEKCVKHEKLADIYCGTCKELVCNACSFGGEHADHNLIEIGKAVQCEEAKMLSEKEQILNCTQSLSEAKSAVKQVTDDAENRAQDLLKRLMLTFGEMRDVLDEKERELKEKIHKEISSCNQKSEMALSQLQDLEDNFNDSLTQIELCTDDLNILQNSAKITERNLAISSKYKSAEVPAISVMGDVDWKVLNDTLETVRISLKTLCDIPAVVKDDTLYPAMKVFQCEEEINKYIIAFLRQKEKHREQINSLAKENKCTVLWEDSTHSIYFETYFESSVEAFQKCVLSEIMHFGVKKTRNVVLRKNIDHIKQTLATNDNVHILSEDRKIIFVGLHENVEEVINEMDAKYQSSGFLNKCLSHISGFIATSDDQNNPSTQ